MGKYEKLSLQILHGVSDAGVLFDDLRRLPLSASFAEDTMKRIAAWLILLSLWTCPSMAEDASGTTVTPPVTKVALYKHGMGYIEREGKVKGAATLSLAFRADQMKDVLLSFFAVDLGGGKISSVRYETQDPVSKRLQDILIKAPADAALSRFLMQLQGASLSAKAAGESIQGRILGIEPVNEIVGGKSVVKGFRLLLMTEAGPVRSLDLFGISEFSLTDESLQRDLRRLLDLSLESKQGNRKKLTLNAIGQGERRIRIGYLVEAPLWKCSYRVIFDGDKKDAAPLLQGYALAENNTEDDWKDVVISFVAGNPMSYVMDLYSPYYIRRPQVPIPGLQNLAVDWGAVGTPEAAKEAQFDAFMQGEHKVPRGAYVKSNQGRSFAPQVAQKMDQAAPSAPPPAKIEGWPSQMHGDMAFGERMASSYGTGAQGAKIGELFSYESKEKVSIPRGQAAMVPILSKPITGRRLLSYKKAFSPRVTNVFVAQNGTDLTLEAGAVTFFEGSTSLGEGILSHTLPPGSQEVIPYAIDASVDVTPQDKTQREPYFKARLVDGILTLTAVEKNTHTWKILNRGKDPATLWLHQPITSGFKLSKPEKPLKEVDRHYRFEVPLKAGETVDFVVEEKRDVQEKVHLDKSNEEQIRFYLAQPYLSSGAKAFMKELSDLMAQKAGLQRQITEWTEQVKRLTEEQGRLRSNLQTLMSNQPKEQELRAKWVAALAANEDRLASHRTKLDDAGAKLRQMEESLAKKIRDYKDE
jgi:hypothetical protein